MATQDSAAQDLLMTPEQVRQWWTRVEQADAAMKTHHDQWDALFQAYLPSKDATAINANGHFRNTESKSAKLFLKNPELRLKARGPLTDVLVDPMTGQPRVRDDGQAWTREDVVAIHEAVLNTKLGKDGVNVAAVFKELLFDALQCSGLMVSLISYEADLVDTPMEVPGPDQPIPGSILGLSTAPTTQTVTVPVPVFEDWTWERVSPKKALIPHDFHSTRFDTSPWLGYKFVMPLARAKRAYQLPGDFTPNATGDDAILKSSANEPARGIEGKSELVEGAVIYYKPAFFEGTNVVNRQVQYCLVLIKGLKDRPAKHRLSPHQTLVDGKLTPDSLTKYPIRIGALRVLADCAVVPADAAFTDPLIKQKNTWRAQDIALRDSNIPRFLFDDQIKGALDTLRHAAVGEGAPVPAGLLANGVEKLIAELPKLEKAMADTAGERAIDRDIAETLAIGANQAGVTNDKVLSATEIRAVEGNANDRLEGERDTLLDYFMDGVRVFDKLLARYADAGDWVAWAGQDGAARLSKWDKTLLGGEFAYEIRPESQLRVDAGTERKTVNDFMNFHAKNPHVNLMELTKKAAQIHGYDPSKLVKQPEPEGPPAPNVSVKVDIESLAGPAGGAALKVLQQAGYQLDETDLQTAQANGLIIAAQEAAQQAQTQHGGAADKADLINKHAEQETGGLNNAPTVN